MGSLAKLRRDSKQSIVARSHEGQLRASARKKQNRGVRRKETPQGFAEAQKLRDEAERKMKADVERATKPKTNPRPFEVEWVPVMKTWE